MDGDLIQYHTLKWVY